MKGKAGLLLSVMLVIGPGCKHKSSKGDDLSEIETTPPAETADNKDAEPLAPVDSRLEDPGFVPESFTLPVVRVLSTGRVPVTSKDDYVAAQFTLSATDGKPAVDLPVQIRGRGNSTWGMPKKPYKLKFADKLELLGMAADKEWALLAVYSDKTLIRTALAFELGRNLGAHFTPQSRFVEVFLNDAYLGVYQLTETVKVGTNRVNIPQYKPKAADPKTPALYSYLLELDARLDGPLTFRSSDDLPFVVKDPELDAADYPAHSAHIKGLIDTMESALRSGPGSSYASLIDSDSFLAWYWVNEIARNCDAAAFSSIYLYRPKFGPIAMGPLWDFDISLGNIDYNDCDKTEGWHIRAGFPWFKRLFDDPDFAAKAKAFWNNKKKTAIDLMPIQIDLLAHSLQFAQKNNFKRWIILDKKVWPNRVVTGSYSGEVQALKDWLNERVAWIDSQVNI